MATQLRTFPSLKETTQAVGRHKAQVKILAGEAVTSAVREGVDRYATVQGQVMPAVTEKYRAASTESVKVSEARRAFEAAQKALADAEAAAKEESAKANKVLTQVAADSDKKVSETRWAAQKAVLRSHVEGVDMICENLGNRLERNIYAAWLSVKKIGVGITGAVVSLKASYNKAADQTEIDVPAKFRAETPQKPGSGPANPTNGL